MRPVSGSFGGTFVSLGHGPYRRLWISNAVASLGFMMLMIVQAVVAYDITGRNGAVGAVTLSWGITQAAAGPFGGALADRFARRRMLMAAQAVTAFDLALTAGLLFAGQLTLPVMVVLALMLGLAFAVVGPSRQALIAESLPAPLLGNGIAMQQLAVTTSRVIAPFLVAAMVAAPFIGAGGAYVFMCALMLLSVLNLSGIADAARGGQSRSVLADVRAGFGHLRERPALMVVLLSQLAVAMFGTSYAVLVPGYVEQALGRDAKDIAWLYGAAAAGGIAVSLGLAGLAGSRHAWRLMALASAVLGGALLLLAAAQSMAQAVAILLLVGVGQSAFFLLNNALILREADPSQHGRMAGILMVAFGGGAMAGLPLGLLADATSERTTLVAMGILSLATAALSAFAAAAVRRRRPLEKRPRPAVV